MALDNEKRNEQDVHLKKITEMSKDNGASGFSLNSQKNTGTDCLIICEHTASNQDTSNHHHQLIKNDHTKPF